MFQFGERRRVIEFRNASDPSAWPRADSSKACIFEAIEIVGRGRHGDQWDNCEFGVLDWRESPIVVHARNLELRRQLDEAAAPLIAWMAERGGARSAQSPNGPCAGPKAAKPYDAHVGMRNVQIEQTRWQKNRTALTRLEDAAEWLAQRCRDGELVGFERPRGGGSLVPMSASEWNVENVLATFVCFGGRKRWFEQGQSPQALDTYIFFHRSEVQRLAKVLPSPPTMGKADAHPSRAAAGGECERMLRRIMQTTPNTTSKSQFCKTAMDEIDGLSKRAFNRAWAIVAPEFGKDRPGAKKKSVQ